METEDERDWTATFRRVMAKNLADWVQLKTDLEEWYAAKPMTPSRPQIGNDPEYQKVVLTVREMREQIASEGWNPDDYPSEPDEEEGDEVE